jgi:hypothetical protein
MLKIEEVPFEEVKYPGWNDRRVPEDAECQEPIGMVGSRFFRCGRPAKAIVALGAAHPYYMCRECALQCVRHRGGRYILGGPSEATAGR